MAYYVMYKKQVYFKIEHICKMLESGPTHIFLLACFCESDRQFYNPI